MKKRYCLLLVFVLLVSVACAPELSPDVTEPKGPDVDGWTLSREDTQEVAQGITYLERTYYDEENKPYRVYILELDPQKVTLQTGTSQNGYEIRPTKRQTVRQHAEAAIADGVNVLAAVNGDFFAIETDFVPTGLSIKDCRILRLNDRDRPYSAVTMDGEYLVSRGNIDQIGPTTLAMAVGGSHILVWEGVIQEEAQPNSLWTTAAPRTLAGKREDGTILLVVVDGRQPQLSNGADLTQCAQLMYNLGAVYAINHDGGGSSTMLLRKGDNLRLMNSPSDGAERRVFCSILVIEK